MTNRTVETVVSYTSGAGSLSQLEVNEFLSLTRTAYLGQAGKQQSMETAMRTALDTAKADAKTSKIAVVQSPSADTDNTKPAASAFAGTHQNGTLSVAAGHADLHVPGDWHLQ